MKLSNSEYVGSTSIISTINYHIKKAIQTLIKKSVCIEIICSLIVILFIYTGLSKLLQFETFKFQLGRSPFIQSMASFIAPTLPLGELIIALLLVFKKTRLWGLYLSFILMLLFTGYIYAMLHYSYYLPCSCGGILETLSWNQHFWLNVFFTLLALTGIILYSSVKTAGNKKTN